MGAVTVRAIRGRSNRSRQSGQPEPPTHTTPRPNARSARCSAYPNEGDPSMAKGIRFYETGGPEVLRWESLPVGEPGSGEVRVRHAAVGLNFADTYFRTGLYPSPLPAGMGVEA